jgi:hypothetical protein
MTSLNPCAVPAAAVSLVFHAKESHKSGDHTTDPSRLIAALCGLRLSAAETQMIRSFDSAVAGGTFVPWFLATHATGGLLRQKPLCRRRSRAMIEGNPIYPFG